MATKEQIKKDVVDQLYWDNRVDASNIKVEVDDGEVTLKGTVLNYMARTAAYTDACAVRGVKSVDNKLTVKFAPSFEVPTDAEIKSNIESTFRWNPSFDEHDLEVEVENGWVTLKGTVDTFWKKIRAESVAVDISGVLGITNKLAVVPTQDIVDKAIAEDIVDAISRKAAVNAENVDVKVKDGEVTLSGTVSDWDADRAAYDAALYTVGVTGVIDNIIVE